MPSLLHTSFLAAQVVAVVLVIILIWCLVEVAREFINPLFSPLRKLNGPTPHSILLGDLTAMMEGQFYSMLSSWKEQYGHVFVVRATFGSLKCITTDKKAVSHILTNHMNYGKPEPVRFHLRYLIGDGILSAEGHAHRNQRRTTLPAFSTANLRAIFPVFLAKSAELRDVFTQQMLVPSADCKAGIRTDLFRWISLATLDIMGLAMFNHEFNALHGGQEGNTIFDTFHELNNLKTFPLLLFLKGFIPALRLIEFDYHARLAQKLRSTFRRIGKRLVGENQLAVLEGRKEEIGTGRDLMSIMMKSNMSSTTPPERRLSLQNILDQISTFVTVGHETTATALAWCMLELCKNPKIQSRLREELLEAFPDDSTPVTIESLNSLPYLEAVVRESLRYAPSVENVSREAYSDDVVPVERPYVLKDGSLRDYIEIKKGDTFVVPLTVMNRMKEVWGDDGDDFRPERWLEDLPSSVTSAPGLYGNIMTFIYGQRSCIGFKFAMLEMKTLLYSLIRAFGFELAVNPSDVVHLEMIISRPMVLSEKEKGSQLPVIIRPLDRIS